MKIVIFITSILMSSLSLAENRTFALNNSVQFFTQEIKNEFTLPQSLGTKQKLEPNFVVDNQDGISLRKVFSSELEMNSSGSEKSLLKAKIEVFYFNRPEGEYLSQQIFIYRNDSLISKCTSYFPLTQPYLVPGVCSGRDGENLYGIAFYK